MATIAPLFSPLQDVLAMANLEVDLSAIQPGNTVTVKWRGKPVFIRHRCAAAAASSAGSWLRLRLLRLRLRCRVPEPLPGRPAAAAGPPGSPPRLGAAPGLP